MKRLLVRCYPARWRARYGEEFGAILEERPLGPFDVADVLLAALDAHLHLRGLGAASEHRRGFAMSLRIGGYAAIGGGLLWALSMIGAGAAQSDDSTVWAVLLAGGSVLLLAALVGLSSFQARRYPRLVWAAFIVPALGAIVATFGTVAMATVGDRPVIGDVSPWYVWVFGTIALLIGSALFGIATWRTGSLSRFGAALLSVGAVAIVPMFGISAVGGVPELVNTVLLLGIVGSFGLGWTWLGLSALRMDGAALRRTPGAALS
jgi:MFS family permease